MAFRHTSFVRRLMKRIDPLLQVGSAEGIGCMFQYAAK